MRGPRKSPVDAVLRAALFAAERHGSGRRKGKGSAPYINHPLAVAAVLAEHGVLDSVTLQAALLHDTVEDSQTTPAELEELFGPAVAGVVMEVTDDETLERAERKRLQIERAPGLSRRAKLIKIGDKICNVRDVAWDPPKGWSVERRLEYLDWTEKVVRGCRGAGARLEACYDRTLAEARRAIASGFSGAGGP